MQQQEILSAYMDGQEINGEFTKTLCSNSELQKTWANYHRIRSVMRGEEQILGEDFSAKMAALLEGEEIEPLQHTAEMKKPKGILLKLKRWSMPVMQAGIAASVCLVAVFGVNMLNSHEEVAQVEQPILQTLPFSNSVQQVSYNAPVQEQPTQEQLEYQQRRLDALLQNHELQRRTQTQHVIVSDEEKAKTDTRKTEQPTVLPKP